MVTALTCDQFRPPSGLTGGGFLSRRENQSIGVKIDGNLPLAASPQFMTTSLRQVTEVFQAFGGSKLVQALLKQFCPLRAVALHHLLALGALFLKFGGLE